MIPFSLRTWPYLIFQFYVFILEFGYEESTKDSGIQCLILKAAMFRDGMLRSD
jgi:hypothetical protein